MIIVSVISSSILRGSAPVSVLVSPTPLPGYPVRFRVAGCHGQSLVSTARRRRAVPEAAA